MTSEQVDSRRLTNQQEVELLLSLYQEEWEQSRQHENHREKVVAIVVTLFVALVGVISANSFELWTISIALAIPFIGWLSIGLLEKLYERSRHHSRRAQLYRNEINKISTLPLKQIWRKARAKQQERFPKLSQKRLNQRWLRVNYAIIAVGALLLIAIITKWADPQFFSSGDTKTNKVNITVETTE